MRLTYWENFGFAVLSAQGQSMVMLPVNSQAKAAHFDRLVQETGLQGIQVAVTACDLHARSSFVGTNMYNLKATDQRAGA